MQTELENKTNELRQKIDGVVIGLLLSIDPQGQPLVAFPGNPEETAVPARTTTQMQSEDVGCEVALMFEGGDPRLPLIIGKIQHAAVEKSPEEEHSALAELDGESIVLSARQNITLKCGKASITLTKAGKVILRGAYLLSRSSGVNRIKGGSVQIN
ncbi:DUF6484 domain-containing protein [Methylomarinum vadi]|uniref:DUF6484 domain-containing protein n=1 Tax=Methylomarinum vadi TaxID=438855 RepID=UPI0006902BCD|nr:DUF6484 domain-containing protein [Methylomarinum vadi]